MRCSSRLSSLFYSLSMKKHFRTSLLGVCWFILYLLECWVVLEDLLFARWDALGRVLWSSGLLLALSFMLKRTSGAWPVSPVVRLRSLAYCWHWRRLSCPNPPFTGGGETRRNLYNKISQAFWDWSSIWLLRIHQLHIDVQKHDLMVVTQTVSEQS